VTRFLIKYQFDFFTRSFKIGLVFGLIFSLTTAATGDSHGVHVAKVQPAKLAAMESQWVTESHAPIHLFVIPDEKNERNLVQIGSIPGLLSFLGYHDFSATVKGLRDFPRENRPPVLLTFLSFRGMVGLGTLFILLTIYGFFIRNRLSENPLFLKIMLFSIPLPYIAIEFGWVLAEVGRQPWIVYGLMRTSDAVSPIAAYQVLVSLVGFVVVYSLLGAAGFYLMVAHAKKGPVLEMAA